MTFEKALKKMKQGKCIARLSLDGFMFLKNGRVYFSCDNEEVKVSNSTCSNELWEQHILANDWYAFKGLKRKRGDSFDN